MLRVIYKQWALDILESFVLMNTGILSAVTLYLKLSGGNQTIATDVSIGTAIVYSFQCNTVLPCLYTPKYCEAANEVVSLVQEDKAPS